MIMCEMKSITQKNVWNGKNNVQSTSSSSNLNLENRDMIVIRTILDEKKDYTYWHRQRSILIQIRFSFLYLTRDASQGD